MSHQQAHHHGFNPMSVNAQTYNHLQNHHANAATHFAQINSFQQHAAILHHPQPMPFGTLLHPTPLLPNSAMNHQHSSFAAGIVSKFSEQQQQQPKMTPNFADFPSINSNFYKPFSNQMQQLSPSNSKSTISIDSSSASTVSERIMSPHSHSTVDSQSGIIASSPPPMPTSPPISNACNQTTIDSKVTVHLSVSSSSSASPLASIASRNVSAAAPTSQQTARTNMQNGLLDILMCPDKYQELISYHQVQNSIIFPSLHAAYPIDALNSPRLPTWEFLQVSSVCLI